MSSRTIDLRLALSTAAAGDVARGRRRRGRRAAASLLAVLMCCCAFTRGACAMTHTVATLGDPGPTLQLTLRQAVMMAGSGDTIDFAAGLTGTITLLHGEIPIKQS